MPTSSQRRSYFDQLPADLFDLPAGRRSTATLVKEAAE
jgi:hypothetical protein